MCLSKVFNERKTQKILKKLPETINVYKVARKDRIKKRYLPYFFAFYPYKEGENNKISNKHFSNDCGFYSFKNLLLTWFFKISSSNGANNNIIIKCKINKKDILKIGKYSGALTFVTSKITIPKYKE